MSITKSKAGRSTKMTSEVLLQLRIAFLMDMSDREACMYANIHPSTLYSYQRKNPEFTEQKRLVRTNMKIKARMTIFRNIDKPKVAMWYLERKASDEFSKDNKPYVSKVKQPPMSSEQIEKVKQVLNRMVN